MAFYQSFMCLGYEREKMVRVYDLKRGGEVFRIHTSNRCRKIAILGDGTLAVSGERRVYIIRVNWICRCQEDKTQLRMVSERTGKRGTGRGEEGRWKAEERDEFFRNGLKEGSKICTGVP